MDFNVLGIKITSCEWGNNLVIRGMRRAKKFFVWSYWKKVYTRFNTVMIRTILSLQQNDTRGL